MSTKQINVHSNSFSPQSTDLNKNQDSVVFVQSGDNAPSSITVSTGLFSTTTCEVGANAASATAYTPLATASGSYTITIPSASPAATPGSGTIKVTG